MNTKTRLKAVQTGRASAVPSHIFAHLGKRRLSTTAAGHAGTKALCKQEFIRPKPAENVMPPKVVYLDQHKRETLMASPQLRAPATKQLNLVEAIGRRGMNASMILGKTPSRLVK